jgi:MarR family transcriptional regulator, organic hydroperoxide resistance regulator
MQPVQNGLLPAEVDDLHQISMRLNWASRRHFAHELDTFGLTVPQFIVLHTLYRQSRGCSMSELAEASLQVSATMTGIVDRLVERGLVQRQRDQADRRSVHIVLDQAGVLLMEQIENKQKERIAYLLEQLSHEERQHMIRLMSLYLEVTLAETGAEDNISNIPISVD